MTTVDTYQKADILDRIAQPPADLLAKLASEPGITSDCTLVVLDDDPTGTQCVHDVSVYTDWSVDSLRQGFAEPAGLFYVLTNSRSFTRPETIRVHEEIGRNLIQAAAGRKFLVISRSDSTLRGHYPLETEQLCQCLEAAGEAIDGEILCPFFKEGGRYTLHGIHYVRDGERLIPAAQTEFAKDATFGYTHSALPSYIEEKTGGRFPAERVVRISIEELRRQDYDAIQEKLEKLSNFEKVCVDAADYCDVKVFAVALYRAMARGKRFLFRTAAGLVKVVGGIPDRPPLTRAEMVSGDPAAGGVAIVGSHTHKTTAQLEALLTLPGTVGIPFNTSSADFVQFKYDASTGLFTRYMKDTPFKVRSVTLDASGEQESTTAPLTVKNLIVQYAKTYTIKGDNNGRQMVEVTGKGDCEFYIGGVQLKGTWERSSLDDSTHYYLEDGSPVVLQPGNTWIALQPTGKQTEVTFS